VVEVVDSIDLRCEPDALAAGRDAVWIACRDGAILRAILRITGGDSAERVAQLDAKPTSITVAAGRVWVTVAE
jgi:hypothetical protein